MTPHRVTLLIVEDDLGLARLQQRRLERAGYTVYTAATAEEGAQRAGQGDIDLIILDEQLPGGVSGMELYRRMRAAGLDVPAILATGRHQEELLLHALRAGVRDFILKSPEYLESLLPAIERVLKQVRTERQLAETRESARQALHRQRELEAEIAERKRKEEALRVAEEALRVSRARLDLVVESTNLGLWYCDLPFAELQWNHNCKRHFDLPPDARVTIDLFYDRLHPDDRERTRQAVENAVNKGDNYDIEYRIPVSAGGVRWIRAIGRTFYDPSGKPLHFDGVTVDVTEQKRAEEMLKEADRRKDEFLAMLGHELRNPLAPIRNAIHILQLVAPSDERVRRPLDVIDRQARQLAGLVDDLLDVSRITRGQINVRKQALDLATVVAQAVETSRPLMEERRHRFELQLPPDSIYVEADPTRLAQVILNLLNNAAKYTEEGGRIWLTVERRDAEVVLRVRDTGMGISADMLPKIFEPFTQVEQTLDRAQGGLGIGLTLVRRLVEIHGGSVRAFSEGRGRGSEFVVRLPVLLEAPPPRPANGVSGAKDAKPSRRILIVDDNKDSAESLAMLMRLLGHDVHTAHDGEAGLHAAAQFDPDIVLLDIGLPRLDGLEVARRLRGDLGLRDALLIAMTGYGQDEDRRRSQGAGFDAHLVKPVDFNELQALLERGVAATAS
jgi:PAS domain S-box-containing protein